MPSFRKPAELRREREIVRTALRRFAALLAPVTAMQLFSGPNGRPLDPSHPGLPPYARRTLDRLRNKGILILSGKFWKVSPDPAMAQMLGSILSDDKLTDQLHLADKYLGRPSERITQEEADEIAEAMEAAVDLHTEPAEVVDDPTVVKGDELEELLVDVPEPDPTRPWTPPPAPPKKKLAKKAALPPEPSAPELPEEQGEELPFPYYVAKRFDMLSEELDDLCDSLPSDTKAHLEGIGMQLETLGGDVRSMVNLMLEMGANLEQLLKLQKDDHEFLMTLKSTLTPKLPEEKVDNVNKRTA